MNKNFMDFVKEKEFDELNFIEKRSTKKCNG